MVVYSLGSEEGDTSKGRSVGMPRRCDSTPQARQCQNVKQEEN